MDQRNFVEVEGEDQDAVGSSQVDEVLSLHPPSSDVGSSTDFEKLQGMLAASENAPMPETDTPLDPSEESVNVGQSDVKQCDANNAEGQSPEETPTQDEEESASAIPLLNNHVLGSNCDGCSRPFSDSNIQANTRILRGLRWSPMLDDVGDRHQAYRTGQSSANQVRVSFMSNESIIEMMELLNISPSEFVLRNIIPTGPYHNPTEPEMPPNADPQPEPDNEDFDTDDESSEQDVDTEDEFSEEDADTEDESSENDVDNQDEPPEQEVGTVIESQDQGKPVQEDGQLE